MRKFEPTLSAKIFSNKPGETEKNLGLLRFPLLGSIKYDGWRIIERGGLATQRSLKPMRNHHVGGELKRLFARCAELGYRGLDGEVIVGPDNHPNSMQNTSSVLNSFHEVADFQFFLFDSYQYADQPYTQRYASLQKLHALIREEFPWVVLVEQKLLHSMEEMLAYEAEVLEQGYEGVMLRKPDAHYKLGRSTMLQGLLMALKRFVDDEALVLYYVEEQQNTNEAGVNELGRTHRTGHAAGMVGKGSMGTMICRSLLFTKSFRLGGGVGITAALRKEIWLHPERFQWRVAKYSFQEIGVVERPRLPRWKGWRAWEDMDPILSRRLLELADDYPLPPGAVSALNPTERPQL